MRGVRAVLAVFLAVWLLPQAALAKASGETVTYKAGETVLSGYLAKPAGATGKLPAVLVVHEWWGQNDYAKMRARMVAELGTWRWRWICTATGRWPPT